MENLPLSGPGESARGTARPVAVSVIILAAGLSSRMQGPVKLLLDVCGEAMIRRTARNVLGFRPVETILVTGHASDRIEAAVSDLPLRCVHNPDYPTGQQGSVRAGVMALRRRCRGVMVVLGDQPLVTPMHFQALVDAFAAQPEGAIVIPYHAGKRGNPVLFAARYIPSIVEGTLNVGCRKLIERHPGHVFRMETDIASFTCDCDTLDDYSRLLALLRGEPADRGDAFP